MNLRARHENARNAIVWNTECCICLSIAEQECMSRQERAPDFAADCVLVNDSGAYTRGQFLRAVSHSVGAHAVPAAANDPSDTDDDDDQDVNGSNQLQSVCPVSAPPSQDVCKVCLIEQRDARLAFVPCGHQRFCTSCVAHLEQHGSASLLV